MSSWLTVIGLVALFAAGGVAVFWWLGPERIWAFFGPADLGPVDFKKLERRSKPNDVLACPSGFCSADADIHPPIFPVDVPTLRKAMGRALITERRLARVAIDDDPPADRYVQRSDTMRFPDTIIVRYIAVPDGGSTVAIYSRSQLGHTDLGVNSARVERWLDKLTDEVAKLKRKHR